MTYSEIVEHRTRRIAEAITAHPTLTRWLLAGPGALAAGVASLMAMPLWLPSGAAGINDIAFPVLLTPLLWALPFFYACLEENLVRGTLVISGAIIVQGALVAVAMAG